MKEQDVLYIHLGVQLDIINDLIEHGVKDPHVLKKQIDLLNQHVDEYNKKCREQDPALCMEMVK